MQKVHPTEPSGNGYAEVPSSTPRKNSEASLSESQSNLLIRSDSQLSDPRKPQSQKLRRIFRIFYVIAVLIVIIVIYWYAPPFKNSSPEYTVDSGTPLKLILKNCRLFFMEDSGLPTGNIKIKGRMSGDDYSNKMDGSTRVLTFKNKDDYIDSCWADLYINPGTTFNDLTIQCEKCYITQTGDNELKFSNYFRVYGTGVTHLMLLRVSAKGLSASVTHGNLHVYSSRVTESVDFSTLLGDIVYQSVNSFTISDTHLTPNVCLYAPDVSIIGSSDPKYYPYCNVFARKTEVVSPCGTSYKLCTSSVCSGAINTRLYTKTGNVFANVIPGDYLPVGEGSDYVVGNNYTKGLDFEQTTKLALTQMNTYFADPTKSDDVLIFELYNTKAFSRSSITFLLSNNPAYLAAYPWWISFFSMGLLIGHTYKAEANAVPGKCPFRTSISKQDILIHQMLANTVFIQDKSSEMAYIYGENYPKITDSYQYSSGFRGMQGTIGLYNVLPGGVQELEEKKYYLTDNTALVLSISLSVALAGFIGIVAFVVLLYALHQMLQMYRGQSDHLNNYLVREESEKRKGSQEVTLNVKAVDKVGEYTFPSAKSLLPSVFSKLPSQFTFLDLLIREARIAVTSSVSEYLDILFTEVKREDIDMDYQPISFNTIKEKYEKFCFLKQIPEGNLLSEPTKNLLAKKGFIFEFREDATTHVLMRLKWKKKKDEKAGEDEENDKAMKGGDMKSGKEETSLDIFFKAKCIVTEFDEDTIDFSEFQQLYTEFCLERHLTEEVVTRMLLYDMFKITSDKRRKTFLKRITQDGKNNVAVKNVKCFNVTMDKMEEELVRLGKLNMLSDDKKDPYDGEPRGTSAIFVVLLDILSVILHLIWMGAFALVPIVMPLFYELEFGRYHISDSRYRAHYEDIYNAPWLIFYKWDTFHPATWAFTIISLIYLFFSTIDIIFYNILMPLHIASLASLVNVKRPIYLKIIQWITWGYLFLAFITIIAYISLFLVWAILGAILNPTAYLCYASGAATFIAFLTMKINQFKDLYATGWAVIQKMIMDRVYLATSGIMKKILAKSGFMTADRAGEAANALTTGLMTGGISGALTVAQERAINILKNTEVGRKIGSLGIDVETVVKISSGDPEAIAELAEKQGLPKPIIKIVQAIIKKNMKEAAIALTEALKNQSINIPPAIIKIIFDLINMKSDLHVSNLTATLSEELFAILKERIPKASPHFELYKDIISQLILGFRSLTINDMESFIATLFKINDFVINSLKSRCSMEESLNPGESKTIMAKYYDVKSGMMKYCIPPHIIRCVEIARVFAPNMKASMNMSLNKVYKASSMLAKEFFRLDPVYLDFIFLVLSKSVENIGSTDLSDEFLANSVDRSKQMQILTKIESELSLPQPILRVIWHICTGDYELNEDTIKAIQQLCQSLDVEIPSSALQFALKLLPLLKFQHDRSGIEKFAENFGISQSFIDLILYMGKSDISSKRTSALCEGPIAELLSSKLKVSPELLRGYLSMFRGELSSDQVILAVKDICERANIPSKLVTVVNSLITIFSSKVEKTLLPAIFALNLPHSPFLLLGRGIAHPMNVEDYQFELLGLNLNHPTLKYRNAINKEDKSMVKEWKDNLIRMLDAEEKIAELKEVNIAMPIIGMGNDAASGITKKEEEEKMTEQQNAEPKAPLLTAIGGTPHGGNLGDEDEQPMLEEGRSHDDSVKKAMGRKIAKLLLTLDDDDANITPEMIELLLSYLPEDLQLPKGKNDRARVLDAIIKIVGIKNIIWVRPDKNYERALSYLGNDLNFDSKGLRALINMINMNTNTENITSGIAYILESPLVSSSEMRKAISFAKLACEKVAILEKVESTINYFGKMFSVPVGLLRYCVLPKVATSSSSGFLSIDDVFTLLNQFGFSVEFMEEKRFKLPGNSSIKLSDLRQLLCGLSVGDVNAFVELSEMVGIRGDIMKFIKAFLTVKPYDQLVNIAKALRDFTIRAGMDKEIYNCIIALIMYFCGYGNMPPQDWIKPQDGKESELRKSNIYEYLGAKLGILPTSLQCLEAGVKGNQKALVKMIPELVKAINNLKGKEIVSSHVIYGIMDIISGSCGLSMEELAEKLSVKQEVIEMCIRMSTLTNSSLNTSKMLNEFYQSPSILKAWKSMRLQPKVMVNLMNLTFNNFSMQELSKTMGDLGLKAYIDERFLYPLVAMGKSFWAMGRSKSELISRGSTIRTETLKDLRNSLKGLCQTLHIDLESALMGIRLRQGDFLILEDYKQKYASLTNNSALRLAAMGCSGILSLKPEFLLSRQKAAEKSKMELMSVSFENSCELLCKAFKINTIVPRLALFDKNSLNELARECNLPVSVISWFIMNIINLPIEVLKFMVLREYYKSLNVKQKEAELVVEIEKNYGAQEGEDGAAEEIPEIKEDLLFGQETGELEIGTVPGSKKKKKVKATKVAAASQGAAQLNPEEEQKKEAKRKALEEAKENAEAVYLNIDFETDPAYASSNISPEKAESKSVLSEIFEILLYNNRYGFNFNKTKGKHCDRTPVQFEDLLKEFFQGSFERDMANNFFTGEQGVKAEIAKKLEEAGHKFNWVEDRKQCANVWQIWKTILKAASNISKEQNNGETVKISTSQILLFSVLMGIKNRMNPLAKYKLDNYKQFQGDIDLFLLAFEAQAILSGAGSANYSRSEILGILSQALNVQIPSFLELASPDMTLYPFNHFISVPDLTKTKYLKPIREFIRQAKTLITDFDQKIAESFIKSNFSEYAKLLRAPNDLFDCVKLYTMNVSPYCLDSLDKKDLAKLKVFFEKTEEKKEEKTLGKKVQMGDTKDTYMRLLSMWRDYKKSALSNSGLKEEQIKAWSRGIDLAFEAESAWIRNKAGFTLLLDLAMSDWKSNESVIRELLENAGYLVHGQSFDVYAALSNLVSSMRIVESRTLASSGNGNKVQMKELKSLLNVISTAVPDFNGTLAESIIILAQGVMEESSLEELANFYSLPMSLIKSFFLSVLGRQTTISELKSILDPLITRLYLSQGAELTHAEIKEKRGLLIALINMYLGQDIESGWVAITQYCVSIEKRGGDIMKEFINMINWNSEDEDKSLIAALKVGSKAASEGKLSQQDSWMKIIKWVTETENIQPVDPLQFPNLDQFIGSFIELIICGFKGNVSQLLNQLNSMKGSFGVLTEEKLFKLMMKLFEICCSKIGIANSQQTTESLKESGELLADWIVSCTTGLPEENNEQYKKIISFCIKIIFSSSWSDCISTLKLEADIWMSKNPQLAFIMKVFEIFQQLRAASSKVPDFKLSMLGAATTKKFLKLVTSLMNIARSIFANDESLEDDMKRIRLEMRKALPIAEYMKLPNYAGQIWSKRIAILQPILESFGIKDMQSIAIEEDAAIKQGKQAGASVSPVKSDHPEDDWDALAEKQGELKPEEMLLRSLAVGDTSQLISAFVYLVDHIPEGSLIKGLMLEGIKKCKVILSFISTLSSSSVKAMTKAELENIVGEFMGIIASKVVPSIDKEIKYLGQNNTAQVKVLEEAKKLLKKPTLLTKLFIVLQKLSSGALTADSEMKKEFFDLLKKLTLENNPESLDFQLPPEVLSVASACIEFGTQEGLAEMSFEDKTKKVFDSFTNLFVPDLERYLPIIQKLITFSLKIFEIGGDAELIMKQMGNLTVELGSIFGCEPKELTLIVGILRGNVKALIEFIAPFCNIDPKIMEILHYALGAANNKLNAITEAVAPSKRQIPEYERAIYEDLLKKAQTNCATSRELFTLIDMEGDKSGGISVPELKDLLARLGTTVSDHRAAEIFARVKRKDSKLRNELEFDEFEEAIKYVQFKRVFEALHLAGISRSQLMILLSVLTVILILFLLFIFMGIVAFALGGNFASVINSVIPLLGGISISRKIPVSFDSETWKRRIEEIVQEVSSIVGGKED